MPSRDVEELRELSIQVLFGIAGLSGGIVTPGGQLIADKIDRSTNQRPGYDARTDSSMAAAGSVVVVHP